MVALAVELPVLLAKEEEEPLREVAVPVELASLIPAVEATEDRLEAAEAVFFGLRAS